MAENVYDLAIIGGGPAGLTAGIYGARAGLKTVILEKLVTGGQVVTTDVVENYPGFPEPISGYEVIEKMIKQATRFGVEIQSREVVGIENPNENNYKTMTLSDGSLSAMAIIVATGAEHRRLGIPGENRLTGRGVSFCATCDGKFYEDKEVVAVGGGDTAIKEVLFLTKFASKITLVHRRDRLRATKILQDRIRANNKVTYAWESVLEEIMGDDKVEAVRLKSVADGKENIIECDGVFVFVGFLPNTGFLKGVVNMDERGYIIAGEDMATSTPGIFACGDARKKLLRQIITACGEGATAAYAAEIYIENLKGMAYENR